jgi:hypothetical protein
MIKAGFCTLQYFGNHKLTCVIGCERQFCSSISLIKYNVQFPTEYFTVIGGKPQFFINYHDLLVVKSGEKW